MVFFLITVVLSVILMMIGGFLLARGIDAGGLRLIALGTLLAGIGSVLFVATYTEVL